MKDVTMKLLLKKPSSDLTYFNNHSLINISILGSDLVAMQPQTFWDDTLFSCHGAAPEHCERTVISGPRGYSPRKYTLYCDSFAMHFIEFLNKIPCCSHSPWFILRMLRGSNLFLPVWMTSSC